MVWLAILQKIFTMDKLLKRRQRILNECPLCLADEETKNHLLIHCMFFTKVWAVFLRKFGMIWVLFVKCMLDYKMIQWNLSLFVVL